MVVVGELITSPSLVTTIVLVSAHTVLIAEVFVTKQVIVIPKRNRRSGSVLGIVIVQVQRILVEVDVATRILVFVIQPVTVYVSKIMTKISMWMLPEDAIHRLGYSCITSDVAYSPDGKHLVFGSRIGVWWYDLSTMTPIALWDTDRGFISAISFSPNGRWFATGDGDGLVKVWDVQRGVCIAQMERDEAEKPYHTVSRLVFSPDSQRLAVSSIRDYILYVYHVETGERLAKFHDETNFKWFGGIPRPIAFSADNNLLACLMPDESLIVHADPRGTIRLPRNSTEFIAVWRIETGEQLACFTDTDSFVQSLWFSPCGQFLAAGGRNGSVRIWSVATWQQTQGYHGYGTGQMQVFYSPAGVLHAAEKSDDTLIMWDIEHREKCELSFEVYRPLQGPHVPTGTPFVLASTTGREFRKWTVGDSEPHSFPHLHTGVPISLVFSPNGKTLAGGYWSEDETVMLWDITEPSTPPTCFNLPGRDYIVSLSTSGKIQATGFEGNTAKVWIVEESEPKYTFTLSAEKKEITAADLAQTGNLLACGGTESPLYVWNTETRETLRTLPHELSDGDFITDLEFSPNGKLLVSISDRGPVSQLWDIESGETIEGFPKNRAFAFSPCSTLIAISNGKEILFWDISSRETLMSIPQPEDSWLPFALTFSPCGRYLASGAWWIRGLGIKKCPVRLWDVESGENIATFRGHCSDVQCLAFSPDGTILASGSYDGTILLWDLKSYL